jgi:ribokinase
VVVTLGGAGAVLDDAEGTHAIAPFTVRPVDTTGAGDTFCGSLCARLAQGEPLAAALRYASAAAALSTTRAGAVPSIPTLAEVNDFISRAG